MNTLFPVFLKADRLNFLLIGGGKVALEKLRFLYKSSPQAHVQLVAPEIMPEVFELACLFPEAQIHQRTFSIEDLVGKHLVIAATSNSALNRALRQLADKYFFLLNIADQPDQCDFYLGGIVTRGDLKLGISTNGKAPILAKRLREVFEEVLPPSLEETIDSVNILRKKLHGDFDEKLKKLNELTKELVK